MQRILLFFALSGCIGLSFEEPLEYEWDGASEGEIITQQTFVCKVDVVLVANVTSGSLKLDASDGTVILAALEWTEGLVSYKESYKRAAPVEVRLTQQDFNGTIDFLAQCA
ncbi:MAG: hypothetical protein ACPHK8_01335 [Thermoplasmatota archaeon]